MLPVTTDCDAGGAICTRRGGMPRAEPEVGVPCTGGQAAGGREGFWIGDGGSVGRDGRLRRAR